MLCPECGTPNESGAPSCGNCGLLLLSLETPRRRGEDLRESRRATDQAWTQCEFCKAEIEASAVRCRHCSEIVDETFRVEPALRRRAAINYASWIAYGVGLLALFVSRPAGLIAIGTGLLLSIAYYAIPVDVTRAEAKPSFLGRMFAALRLRLPFEVTSLRLPLLTRRQLMLAGSPVLVVIAGFLVNFYLLQHPMNQVLRENPSYRGMQINTHYAFWMNPGVVVYDLEGVSGQQSRLDVHIAFLEYAKRLRLRKIRRVELRYRGDSRLSVDGAAFRQLGEEYANRNYAFALFEFPRTVGDRQDDADIDGREALMRFHDHWYADALLSTGGR